MEEIESFKSIKEFADIVHVLVQTIRRMVKEGKLPTLPRGEKHVLIPLNAGSARLVEISIQAMNEKNDTVAARFPVIHTINPPPARNSKYKGRPPDSVRLAKKAR